MINHKIGTPGYISVWVGNEEDGVYYYENKGHLMKNLVPTEGRDWFHAQLYTNTVQAYATIGAVYLAVSETTVAPDPAWTAALFTSTYGEITTGTLARKLASPVPSHIIGTNVSITETTWTPSASFPAVSTLALFNAASAGKLVHAGRFDQVVSVVSGQAFRALATINHG